MMYCEKLEFQSHGETPNSMKTRKEHKEKKLHIELNKDDNSVFTKEIFLLIVFLS